MIDLPDVTLCCVDTRHHDLAIRALTRSMRQARFGRVKFLTHTAPPTLAIPRGVEIRDVGSIDSLSSYSDFILRRLIAHVDTNYVLVTQWDGYVVHADAWNPAFMECDYIGAVWPQADGRGIVGNGGFSLRSRKLLEALQDPRVTVRGHEDQTIARSRSLLEAEYGIQVATVALANLFSFELDQSIGISGRRTFGFHGLFNFFLVEPELELVELADQLPGDILRSLSCRQLFGNCYNFKQWTAAVALGRRMMEIDPDDADIAAKVVDARTMLSATMHSARHRASTSKGFLRRLIGRR
jgi:hypothetical protein